MFVWLQALLFVFRHVANGDEFVNIHGEALAACSSEGMALTGWTRNGSCIDENDDEVSARQKHWGSMCASHRHLISIVRRPPRIDTLGISSHLYQFGQHREQVRSLSPPLS